ncbi:MAG: ABC transporter substrate-binding protein [Eubacteriales bacterium]|nr:ABC transporter substrate-binding protein [Eubacteriales bacterium]
MKLNHRLLSAVCSGALLTGLLSGCGGPGTDFDGTNQTTSDTDTLRLYIWGEYTGDELIETFEEEYDCHVIVETFDSNEMMYTKISSGDRYDVLVPSDYMIERLMNEDFLQPLDREVITNFDLLDPNIVGLEYDPDNTYSIPYFWGTVGIVYNKNTVDRADLEEQGWNILTNTKYQNRLYLYDSERDSFMMAFKALGYSMNTDKDDEIEAAYEWLCNVNNTMHPVYVTDEIIDNMINGTKDIGIVYSGDAAYILSENEDMSYYCPTQGTNIWSDAMVIPKNAPNSDLANEFINYVLTYDASYDNTEEVGYTSSNAQVAADVYGEGGIYEGNEAYVPRSDYELDEVFRDNEYLRQRLSELWIKVKAGGTA